MKIACDAHTRGQPFQQIQLYRHYIGKRGYRGYTHDDDYDDDDDNDNDNDNDNDDDGDDNYDDGDDKEITNIL